MSALRGSTVLGASCSGGHSLFLCLGPLPPQVVFDELDSEQVTLLGSMVGLLGQGLKSIAGSFHLHRPNHLVGTRARPLKQNIPRGVQLRGIMNVSA